MVIFNDGNELRNSFLNVFIEGKHATFRLTIFIIDIFLDDEDCVWSFFRESQKDDLNEGIIGL